MISVFTVSISDTSCPCGGHLSLFFHLRSVVINCLLCLEEDSPHLLFPGVNEMRRERLPRVPRECAVLQDGLSSPLPQSDISNRAMFEVLGWVPSLSAPGRELWCLFNSGSPYVSSFFCICIPNKQEIVFICMQMCLSPRLGF